MKYVRFRDPAGAIRCGTLEGSQVHFANESYGPTDEDIDVLPPCEPSKIVCIGRNYADHVEEMDNDVPDRPLLFLKPPNTLAGHGDTVTPPARKDRIDYEAGLGVVIGEQCRHVPEAKAMDVVEGFTCVNDVSNRDDQEIEQNWIRGKAFDGAAPIGPVLATPDEVPADDRRIQSERRDETAELALPGHLHDPRADRRDHGLPHSRAG